MTADDHERCEACGFDGARHDDGALLDAVRALGPRWTALLGQAGPALRVRPAPAVWSAIEYAAHTRDILALHAFGVEQALTEDEPAFPPVAEGMADEAAAGYADLDPADVARHLDRHARRLADLAADAAPAGWARGITIGDERRDVRRLVEHALHDALHHVDDVERGLRA